MIFFLPLVHFLFIFDPKYLSVVPSTHKVFNKYLIVGWLNDMRLGYVSVDDQADILNSDYGMWVSSGTGKEPIIIWVVQYGLSQ